jgi:hypothetical protein
VDAQARYEELVEELAARDPAVQAGTMFGKPVVKRNRKVVAGLDGTFMLFKLSDPDEREQALALDGAGPFVAMGRPMREWVQVPFEHADEWPTLAEAALRSAP